MLQQIIKIVAIQILLRKLQVHLLVIKFMNFPTGNSYAFQDLMDIIEN